MDKLARYLWMRKNLRHIANIFCWIPARRAAATDLASLAGLELPRPYFLAGGLNTDNIRLALARCAPAGLDLNSGVEDAPGVKNAAKMAECARIARNIETNFQH